jgi:spore coat protein U-like protein
MLNHSRKIVLGASALSLAALAGTALAVTNPATGTLGATLTILKSCQITATTQVDFGSVDPTLATDASGVGSVSVACTKGTVITDIKLSAGGNFASGSRQMSDGTNFVPYALFTDAAHTTAWGDGGATLPAAALSTGFVATTSAATPQSFSVYGLVLAADEDVPTATYTDTVNITVDY